MENIALASMGAGCLVIENSHVLLVKLNYGPAKNQWILPGGMVEPHEHPHQAAIRELKEETNLNGKIIEQISVRHRIDSNERLNIYWVFRCEVTEGLSNAKNMKWPEEEILEAKYWPLKEALESDEVRPMTKLFINIGVEGHSEKLITNYNSRRKDIVYW